MAQVDIGKCIMEARKKHGLTQEQFGKTIGVTGQAVSKWELGESMPDVTLLPNICRTLTISADQLLGIEDTVDVTNLMNRLLGHICESAGDDTQALDTGIISVYKEIHSVGSGYRLAKCRRSSLTSVKNDSSVLIRRTDGFLRKLSLFDPSGLVLVALDGAIDQEINSDVVDTMRLVLSPVYWEIVIRLLAGPLCDNSLIADVMTECSVSEPDVQVVLDDLTQKGIIIHNNNGYTIDGDGRTVAIVVMLKCIGTLQTVGAVYTEEL